MEGEGYIYVGALLFLLVVVAILTGREVRRPEPQPEIPPGATACPSCGNVFYPKVQKKPKPSNPQPSSPLILPGGSWPTYPGGGGPIVIYPSQGGGQKDGGGDE
jgi:hypothetical protein